MKLAFWKKKQNIEKLTLPKKKIRPNLSLILVSIIFISLIFTFALIYMLNEKVTEVKEERNTLLDDISKSSIILDKNSGTNYSKDMQPSNFKNPGSISQILPTMNRQSEGVIKQRDSLAKTLSNTLIVIDPSVQVKDSDFSDISKYEKNSALIQPALKNIFDEYERLSRFIILTAVSLNIKDVDVNQFSMASDENFQKSILEQISNNNSQVAKLTAQLEQRESQIKMLKDSVDKASTSGEEFRKLYNQQQKEYETIKLQFEELKANMDKKQGYSELSDDDDFEEEGGNSNPEQSNPQQTRNIFPEFYYKLTGQIVDFNSNWGFVIINIGSESNLTLDIDGTTREVTVPAPSGQEIYIARGDTYIAKAKIVSVYAKYSVANVISPTNGEINKGDSIFFDTPQSNTNP